MHEDGVHILDPAHYATLLRGDYVWAAENVPFIDVPELPDVQIAYYYRWRSYKRHITPTPVGWVVTEFLPPVAEFSSPHAPASPPWAP